MGDDGDLPGATRLRLKVSVDGGAVDVAWSCPRDRYFAEFGARTAPQIVDVEMSGDRVLDVRLREP